MRSIYFLGVLISTAAFAFSAPVFEMKEGDRVAMLGDAFIEREQYAGWIEIAATTQFPNRAITFRNLGWSADTPAGDSRNGLSLVMAGSEPSEEGWRQLQNQLVTYKPTVVVLGYGMAASLPGGPSAGQFRKDLERLLEAAPKSTGADVRFLILGAPPRFERPGETPESLKLHCDRLVEIDSVLRRIATNRNIPFVSLADLTQDPAYSQNGIHLTNEGYRAVARHLEKALSWKPNAWDHGESAAALRTHILKKNEWFFHRSRPANMAYIFGFRKKEQGQNAGEIAGFDKLVAEEEAVIASLRDLTKNIVVPEAPVRTESAVAAKISQAYPEFTVADGYEISLWAENPLLHKPTQINFDPSGRLWVASSQTYPQVEVGQTPNDKIIVLEDSDRDGKADKSSVFADGMMMPTAVLPGDGGVYVGQSTDLLHFKDTNGDGKADVKTRILSGFGTEDTHHNIHTLRRGPDGRLWFNQSIYTRSDVETPGEIFRLKSGGIMRFDPRTSKLESVFYGWCNPWGHQFDRYGQSFVTDGAGGEGINWGVPGAMYFTFAKAGKILGSISPGSYPKLAGLEIVESPHFPKEWQGSMISCDFRAHRIVRFGIAENQAGFAAQEMGDLVRTDSVNFRPIDAKIGPDGALYIADWSNPIINHGEVDFRDPRRDREHGRIWKVTRKDSALATVRDFNKLGVKELLAALSSDHRYDREQATAVLVESKSKTLDAAIQSWQHSAADDRTLLAALWLSQGRNLRAPALLEKVLASKQGEVRAAGIRVLGDWLPENSLAILKTSIADEHPRVRIEAIRVLAKLPGWEAMDTALNALEKPRDRFIDYALWLNVQQRGEEWLAALMNGRIKAIDRFEALQFTLTNLPPGEAAPAITQLLPQPMPRDGSGPWLELAINNGDAEVIGRIYQQIVSGGFEPAPSLNALRGVTDAIIRRRVPFSGDALLLLPLLDRGTPESRIAAVSLAGATAFPALLPRLIAIATDDSLTKSVRSSAVAALANFSAATARQALIALGAATSPLDLRQDAALALTRHHRAAAVPMLAAVAAGLSDTENTRRFWQATLSSKGISKQLAAALGKQPMSPEIASLALQHIPDVAEHDALLKILREQAGSGQAKTYSAEQIRKLAEMAEKQGDASRGELVYRRTALACTVCHAIGGAGGKVGPDMTSIGASAPLDYLVESVVLPGAKVKEGYHSVMIETKDGKAIMGQLLKHSGGVSVIRDGAGAEVSIADSMVVKKTDAGSLMPGNLIATLPENDVNDLFKFLSQLGKPGEFDATNSRAPRIWAVVGLKPENQEAASQGDPALGWVPLNATVNGRLLPQDVKATVGVGGEIMVGTKLQLAQEQKISLVFPDGFIPVDLWIDGQSSGSGQAILEAGKHTIVIRCLPKDLPLRMTCDQGTFLPEW